MAVAVLVCMAGCGTQAAEHIAEPAGAAEPNGAECAMGSTRAISCRMSCSWSLKWSLRRLSRRGLCGCGCGCGSARSVWSERVLDAGPL